jgi:hypothetical protein
VSCTGWLCHICEQTVSGEESLEIKSRGDEMGWACDMCQGK